MHFNLTWHTRTNQRLILHKKKRREKVHVHTNLYRDVYTRLIYTFVYQIIHIHEHKLSTYVKLKQNWGYENYLSIVKILITGNLCLN